MDSSPDLFLIALVSSFVLLYHFRLNSAAGIDRDAILSRPYPHRLGVRPTRRGLSTSRRRTAASARYFTASVGKTSQGLTQFIYVSLVEINFVFTAVESERYRFLSFRAVDIIFQQHDCLFCHKTRLSVR